MSTLNGNIFNGKIAKLTKMINNVDTKHVEYGINGIRRMNVKEVEEER